VTAVGFAGARSSGPSVEDGLTEVRTGGASRVGSRARVRGERPARFDSVMLRLHRLLGCAVLLLATTSFAAPGDRADHLFREGRQAYMRGDFTTAAADQAEAWKLRKSFDIAANLGQAELKLEQYRDAAEHLRYALDHFPASLGEHARHRLSETFDKARARVAELTLQVTPDGAQLFVDKKPAGAAPLGEPIYLEPGMHEVRAELHGYETEQRAFAVRAGETQSLTLALKPASASAPAPTASAPPAATTAPPSPSTSAPPDTPPPGSQEHHGLAPRTIALITGAGLTAVSLGVGVGFAVKASSANSDAQDALAGLETQFGASPCLNPTPSAASGCSRVASLRSDRNSANEISTVAFVTSGVFAAATVATFFLWPRRTASSTAALRFVPALSRQSGEVFMMGSF
jgi:PEGA domain